MASTTGIEIGPDSYLLAGVRGMRDGRAEIVAVRRFDAYDWPADKQSFADALRTIRRDGHFPRRAAIVLWNTADAIDRVDQIDPLEAVIAAGFEVVSASTPPQALARLATRARNRSSQAIAWIALNTWGASLAIIRAGDVLFSRTFAWQYKADLATSRAQLLQRYLLVSHLAPELTHGCKTVREVHGDTVALAVTCGNLPDIRSFTLPLIEELDIEVETLDSPEDIVALATARSANLSELAPAIRLAGAAALTAGVARRRDSVLFQATRVAAAAAVAGALGWVGYSYWHGSEPAAVPTTTGSRRVPSEPSGEVARVPSSQPAITATPQPVATGGSRRSNTTPTTAAPAPTAARVASRESRRDPSDTPRAATLPASASAPRADDPLPTIDTVLIDQDRRLAILNGTMVGVGDAVGSRVVVAIAREAILLREPSGHIVRVRPRTGM